MKTVQQLQQEVYQQALDSGYFRNMQAQLKNYVFDLIEKQYGGSHIRGFQYQHPLLQKMRQYPLTSLCMDLIQQFLQSFKFKHTLNVFKKQINRNYNVSRKALAQQFRVQIRNPEAQAVLVSIVTQMASGDVGAARDVREPVKNNFIDKKQEAPARINSYIQNQSPAGDTQQPFNNYIRSTAPSLTAQKNTLQDSSSANNSSSIQQSNSSINQLKESTISNPFKNGSIVTSQPTIVNQHSNSDTNKQSSELKDQKKGKMKKKIQKQKAPEAASDLIRDVMDKFKVIEKVNKEEEKKNIFEAKRVYSEEKKVKVVDPSESGANKIRGTSMGKGGMSSMMSKFMPATFQPPKNESYVDEEIDDFQVSRDSTRRNPLFSSSESGFEKSGFDYSVDSNSIDQYEYSQRARKVFKKP